MKKLILMLALIGGTLGSSANSSKADTIDDYRTCSVTVEYYDASGAVVGTQTFSSDQPTLSACRNYQISVLGTL